MYLAQFLHPTLSPDAPGAVIVRCPACGHDEPWSLDELRDHGLCRTAGTPCLMCQPPRLRVEAWALWEGRLCGPDGVWEGPSALSDCDAWAEEVIDDAERRRRPCEVCCIVHAHPPVVHCSCPTRRLCAYNPGA